MIKKIVLLIFVMFSTLSFSSTLSFMVKDDDVTESYLKIKNKADPIYLSFYCNNFINDVSIDIRGLNASDFMNKNLYSSIVLFGNDSSSEKWKVKYDKNSHLYLSLDGGGINFVRKMYDNGQVLIDMKELNGLKFYTVKNKKVFNQKLDMIFQNCSIYF